MTNMITRCPACETSFRITEAQLKTARGAVRCGSCLQIFKAAENLVPPKGAEKTGAPPARTTQKTAATPPARQRTSAAQPARQSAAARPATGKSAGAAPGSRSGVKTPATAKATVSRRPTRKSEDASEADWRYDLDLDKEGHDSGQNNMLRFDRADADEGDALGDDFGDDLLISDEMSLGGSEKKSSVFGDDLSESFLELDGVKPTERSLFDRTIKPKANDDEQADPDESWAISLLEEDEGEPAPPPPKAPSYDSAPDANPFAGLELEPSHKQKKNDPPKKTRPRDAPAPTVAAEDGRIEPRWSAQTALDLEEEFTAGFDDADLGSERNALLRGIEPEPVEFSAQPRRNWRKSLLWSFMALLGLAALVAQVGWLQFDRLSRKQPYRDLYAKVCPILACELPSLAAPELIRTSNLVVRSHPRAEGALMVDTILLNTAPFRQPFPDLVLTFSNIHGETLAARRFTPREYLAGELAGQNQMPSNQPIHLSLEIVDPGPDAVNYSAYIPDK